MGSADPTTIVKYHHFFVEQHPQEQFHKYLCCFALNMLGKGKKTTPRAFEHHFPRNVDVNQPCFDKPSFDRFGQIPYGSQKCFILWGIYSTCGIYIHIYIYDIQLLVYMIYEWGYWWEYIYIYIIYVCWSEKYTQNQLLHPAAIQETIEGKALQAKFLTESSSLLLRRFSLDVQYVQWII